MHRIIPISLLFFLLKPSYSQKLYEKDYAKAELYFQKGAYFKAAQYDDMAANHYADDHNYLQHAAICAVELHKTVKAEKLLWKLKEKNDYDKELYITLGDILMMNGKYGKAKYIFSIVKNKDSLSAIEVNKKIAGCDSVFIWSHDGRSARVFPLDKINSEYDEITPVAFEDKLVFASAQERNIILPKSVITGQPHLDFWISEKKKEKWQKPHKYQSTLNTIHDDYALQFSSDGKSIFMTRTEVVDSSSHKLVAKLYTYESDKENWKKPLVFNYDQPNYSFMHPSISETGKILFFASDMPGGYGGMDLYFCIQKDGKWSSPINLGEEVNTSEDEIYPFYKDGELYFSSNGHAGYGGFDIFRSMQKGIHWTAPKNLEAPINSSRNDISYTEIEGKAYFSSNKKGGKGGHDIYWLKTE